jgi:UDP-N-acetylglucosamine/UDP-N-acetylgalactosamine 4-epimerase
MTDMKSAYEDTCERLRGEPRTWLVTGVAGFIGSHLLETLLGLDQVVVGVDNFSTGRLENLRDVNLNVSPVQARRFKLIEGDICDPELCQNAARGVDFVLHQAALGSVPRSIEDPLSSHESNVTGFVNVLCAARAAGVSKVVYASSSSVYGNDESTTKTEARLGTPLSPYAVTKLADELYAGVFAESYGLDSVGLRYFNVFGPRQDPNGPYAAVIPRWAEQLIRGEPCVVFGTPEKSRDFCFVENVVQCNLLAACGAASSPSGPRVFNVACGERTTLRELFALIRDRVARHRPEVASALLHEAPARAGDIEHSLADIERARTHLGYQPGYDIRRGLDRAVDHYVSALAEPPRRVESKVAAG